MNDAFVVSLRPVVPKHATDRFVGWNARLRLPAFIQRALLRGYVRPYDVDLTECEGAIDDYNSRAEFFVRALRPGVRPIDPDPDVLVSPVDARVHTFGTIEDGTFLQADGKRASIAERIGACDPRCPAMGPELAETFEGGGWTVLYLSPRVVPSRLSPAPPPLCRPGSGLPLPAWQALAGLCCRGPVRSRTSSVAPRDWCSIWRRLSVTSPTR